MQWDPADECQHATALESDTVRTIDGHKTNCSERCHEVTHDDTDDGKGMQTGYEVRSILGLKMTMLLLIDTLPDIQTVQA